MRQSKLFTKTLKEAPKDEISLNSVLLIRAGLVDKLTAGVYTFLPLGLLVLNKIKNIIREEMNAIGAQEIFMPALQPKEPWAKTGRWTDPGPEVMFQFKGRSEKEYGLGWTHEEIITTLAKKFVSSYKDLPFGAYQIQDKFRNEPRAKSGLLRGIEFSMKDLYSFHADEKDLQAYYEMVMGAYAKIFERCGLQALVTEASGGSFSKFSHEYQVLAEAGEDTIYYCEKCRYARNKEIYEFKPGDKCPKCSGVIIEGKAIEVGNIFPLKDKYSKPLELFFADEKGERKPVMMGCYGLGPSRVMGTIVEVYHDQKGIIWPEALAPLKVHLLALGKDGKIYIKAKSLYEKLLKEKIEVLYDDRQEISAGQKFAESDLLGLPYRLVVSEKAGDKIEIKKRNSDSSELIDEKKLLKLLS